MENETLNIQTLRKALHHPTYPLSGEPFAVLHPLAWDNLKEALGWTDTQMERLFIKATYIEEK